MVTFLVGYVFGCFTVKGLFLNNFNQVSHLQKTPKSNQYSTFYTLRFTASLEIEKQNPHANNTILSSCHNTLLLNNVLTTRYGGPLLQQVSTTITDIHRRIPEDISVDLLYLMIFSSCS